MDTLYHRPLEVCADRGIDGAKNKAIQTLTGLSSGRVTQIKQEGERARLGEEVLRNLTRLGYSPDWLQLR